jgi:RND superfamily putative drug exporter
MRAPVDDGRAARAVGAVGRASARHRFAVIGTWLLLVGALVTCARVVGTPTDNDVSLPGTDAQLVRDLTVTPAVTGSTGTVILVAPGGRLDDDARAATLAATSASLERAPHVTQARPPSTSDGSLSADGRTGWFSVSLDVSRRNVTPAMSHDVTDAARPAAGAGLRVLPGGALAEAVDRSAPNRTEYIGLAVAAVVLTLALGGLLGAALPLLTSVLALLATLETIGLAGNATAMPTDATTLATMVGLGVGIDYSLFLLSRFRERAAAGVPVPGAIGQAVAGSGTAVAFAGVTVSVALGGLGLAGVPILATLAWTSGIAVLFAVLAALTLLPALMSLTGRRLARGGLLLNRLRGRRSGAARSRGRHVRVDPRGWARQADRVTRRPWLTGCLALALLALLAAPATDLRLGQLDGGSSPASTAVRQANDVLSAAFGPGQAAPLIVLAQLPAPATGTGGDRVAALVTALHAQSGVAAVGTPAPSGDGRIVTVPVLASTAGSDPATARLVHRLRGLHVPGLAVHVGGSTAARADLADRVTARLPVVIGVVLLLSVAVLLVAFRAPLVALKAAAMDLISIGAAYGALTAVFTWGWGVTWIGLTGPVPIQSYVPLMLFALLFGLSMDYEVFLLTAVQRSWHASGDNLRSVREGLAATGGVITAAATIMVSVFAAFVPNTDPTIKMFGVGLAVAVTVDATIVRGLLAPATMALLGAVTWWTPRPWTATSRPNATTSA